MEEILTTASHVTIVKDVFDFVLNLTIGDLERSRGREESRLRRVMLVVALELRPMIGSGYASLYSCYFEYILCNFLSDNEWSLLGHEVLAMLCLY